MRRRDAAWASSSWRVYRGVRARPPAGGAKPCPSNGSAFRSGEAVDDGIEAERRMKTALRPRCGMDRIISDAKAFGPLRGATLSRSPEWRRIVALRRRPPRCT